MTALQNLPPERQKLVRDQVRGLLGRAQAYQSLPDTERARIARGLVDVVAFLADPAAGQPELAEAMADKKTAAEKTGDRLAGKQDVVGKDFKAAATEAGTKAFRELVDSVDFPKFVSGLIEGVFTSIVDSSIRQMQAYGKLLEGVVKSVDQFASDHISQNQARDYLSDRFPETFTVDVDGGKPRLRLRPGLDDEEKSLAEIKSTLGMEEDFDLDDEEGEARLTRRAQLEMARTRQQQLATMVLLGINRIVVTDGLINAKVVFDVKAHDNASRKARASLYDQNDTATQSHSGGGWFSGDFNDSQNAHKTVVTSSVDDTSESKAQLKANLTGEVRVNFKSETFPLEKMASSVQIQSVNERAQK